MWGTLYNGAYCVGDGSFGLVGNSQYDQCSRWCLIRCPSRGEQGGRMAATSASLVPALLQQPPTATHRSPRNQPTTDGGAGAFASKDYQFYGVTNYYPGFFYASLGEGVALTNTSAANATTPEADVAATKEPFRPTKPMQAAACASGATLSAALLRSGTVDAGAGLGLAFPAVAVAPNGAAVISFTYSGPGKLPADDSDDSVEAAFPGVGIAVVDGSAKGAVPMTVLQRGTGPVTSAEVQGVRVWGELSGAQVHPVSGAVYVAARRGGGGKVGRHTVGTWVGVLPLSSGALPSSS